MAGRAVPMLLALMVVAGRPAAGQDPETVVVMECSGAGPAALECVGVGTLPHELAGGNDGLGANTELMETPRAPVAAGRCDPASDQLVMSQKVIIAAPTGISVDDIRKYGPLGGPFPITHDLRSFVERALGIKF